MSNHLIQRQVLELNISAPRTAPQLQEQIRTLYWEQIHPAMEQLFSAMAPTDVVIRLDKLEVDLGHTSVERFKEAVLEKVQAKLEETLVRNEAPTTDHWSAYHRAIASSGDEDTLILSAPQSRLYALLAFLETGMLPWWTPPGKQHSTRSLLAGILEDDPAPLIDLIRRKASARMERRLSEQFPAEQLISLWEAANDSTSDQQLSRWQLECQYLLKATAAANPEGRASLDPATFRDRLRQSTRHSLAKLILHPDDGAQGNVEQLTDRILEQAIRNTGQDMGKTIFLLQSTLTETKTAAPQVTRTLRRLQKKYGAPSTDLIAKANPGGMHDLNTDPPEDRTEQLPLSSAGKATDASDPGRQPNAQTATGDAEHRLREESSRLQITLEEGVFVSNAGLILLAPFLPPFFKQLGLTTGKAFASEVKKERAVLLTQYLVTSQTEMDEADLLLNKLLCAWPPPDPVAGQLVLTEVEARESEDLLRSVAGHWKALGKTSNETLRETFLRREGKLVSQEPNYKLLVERKGVDILLDRLPWSIGYLKLPWMDYSIRVEW